MSRVTTLEIDTNKFLSNIKKIRKYVGNKELMPIIKANAYGTYINKRLDIINNFNIVGVAIVDEAISLRKLGYQKEIFVLNQPSIKELQIISENNITIGISDESFIKEVNCKIKVHLEIETGMNRTGINFDNLERIMALVKNNKNIEVEGVYTHLSSADRDKKYTEKQITIFKKAVEKVKENFDIKYIHCSASNGLLNYKENFTNLVRPGIIMYGYPSFEESNEIVDFEPIAKLKTEIVFLKDVEKNTSIGYSRKYITKKQMKIATIPIGYADGFRRVGNKSIYVLIKGIKCKVLGNICMDSCMVDVTGLDDVKTGEDVYIFDNENITLEDIADTYNTINYEVLSTISERVPRTFID